MAPDSGSNPAPAIAVAKADTTDSTATAHDTVVSGTAINTITANTDTSSNSSSDGNSTFGIDHSATASTAIASASAAIASTATTTATTTIAANTAATSLPLLENSSKTITAPAPVSNKPFAVMSELKAQDQKETVLERINPSTDIGLAQIAELTASVSPAKAAQLTKALAQIASNNVSVEQKPDALSASGLNTNVPPSSPSSPLSGNAPAANTGASSALSFTVTANLTSPLAEPPSATNNAKAVPELLPMHSTPQELATMSDNSVTKITSTADSGAANNVKGAEDSEGTRDTATSASTNAATEAFANESDTDVRTAPLLAAIDANERAAHALSLDDSNTQASVDTDHKEVSSETADLTAISNAGAATELGITSDTAGAQDQAAQGQTFDGDDTTNITGTMDAGATNDTGEPLRANADVNKSTLTTDLKDVSPASPDLSASDTSSTTTELGITSGTGTAVAQNRAAQGLVSKGDDTTNTKSAVDVGATNEAGESLGVDADVNKNALDTDRKEVSSVAPDIAASTTSSAATELGIASNNTGAQGQATQASVSEGDDTANNTGAVDASATNKADEPLSTDADANKSTLATDIKEDSSVAPDITAISNADVAAELGITSGTAVVQNQAAQDSASKVMTKLMPRAWWMRVLPTKLMCL